MDVYGWIDGVRDRWGSLDKIVIRESNLLMLFFCIVVGIFSLIMSFCLIVVFEERVSE